LTFMTFEEIAPAGAAREDTTDRICKHPHFHPKYAVTP
jgi:hypothetical protein